MWYVCAILFLLSGCSSEHSILKVEEPLEKPINFVGEKAGFRNGKVILQTHEYLESRLNQIQHNSLELLESIEFHVGELKSCYERLADPRIGGDGKYTPIKFEKPENQKEVSYTHDEDRNTIMVVSEEDLTSRITRLEKEKILLKAEKEKFEQKNEECQLKYKTALINHGLDPEATKAHGEWIENEDGVKIWSMTRQASYDPEELAKRK